MNGGFSFIINIFMITVKKSKVTIPSPVKPDMVPHYKRLFATHQNLLREFARISTKYKNEVNKSRKLAREIAQLKALLRARGGE